MGQSALKEAVIRLLPRVQTPGQYVGGEWNSIVKDHRQVRGKLCLAFPDTYPLGMSHHGLQVLYALMNNNPQWACERAFTPWMDFEDLLRRHALPLYGLETFTPLGDFDVVGFSLQYEVGYTNVLTLLNLGGIPLHSQDRTLDHPLVIAGGPGALNPEVLAPFIDVFVMGDGEESLPWLMEKWISLKEKGHRGGDGQTRARSDLIAELVGSTDWAYAPAFYEPEYRLDGTLAALKRTRTDVPREIRTCTLTGDFGKIPLPTQPVVPFVECAHDRLSLEIMRGCPWQCRFCQSTVSKRPLRFRSVETIVQAALESFRHTGYDEISLLSLSTSDYPHFEELVQRLHEVFTPLGVNISLPSLRINHQLRSLPQLAKEVRKSGLTLAPEVARDDMREQIRKKIKNDDLFEGCRQAFRNGWQRVKLYFLCGLPGERTLDLDGIVDMAETIAALGKQERGRYAQVIASVSNFVPKPHTPYQWHGRQTEDYLRQAGRYLKQRCRLRSVRIKQHDIQTSMLEGVLTRGDRRVAAVLEEAWRRGCRLDGWRECFRPQVWWQAFADLGLDPAWYAQRPRPVTEVLPWDHIIVKKGRDFLEKEHHRSLEQLLVLADAK
jgi:radical SAM family uncharacterized protein